MQIRIKEFYEPESSIMELRLKQKNSNEVLLIGYDNRGNEWTIAKIKDDGICLWRGIAEHTKWPLDSEGRLKVTQL